MSSDWIGDAIKRPGAFTKKAEERGMNANLAKTLAKLRNRKKN